MKKKHVFLDNNEKIGYATYGDGAHSLILFHGLVGSALLDTATTADLPASDVRLVVVERPGYGESDCIEMDKVSDFNPMLERVMSELDIRHADLVGISAGASYAYAAAGAWPEKVGTVYILGGLPAVYRKSILDVYPESEQAFYDSIRSKSLKAVQDIFYDIMTPDAPVRGGKNMPVDKWLAESIKNNCHGMANQVMLQIQHWGVELEQIRSKVRLYHSPHDEEVPFAAAELMAGLFPDAELIPCQAFDASQKEIHVKSIGHGLDWVLSHYKS
ncbi:MAG: alpha/beta hydrolase [Desulfobacterales bacterium]|nr:alpha/beta hydrolase [Desulfobacterales bacterium]